MTSVPGIDHPEEQTEAEITLSGRGVSVSSRVEVVQNEFISVRPSVGEFVEQVVVTVGDVVEVFWKTEDAQRALPAEITDVETGAVVRWRMRATGPAEISQRRKAVRGRVNVPVVAGYGALELTGTSIDLSEAGLRAEFEGLGAPPEAGAKLDLTITLEDGVTKTKAEVVRTQARGARWVMSIRFLDIQERDQDRVRKRVFQALREERARKADDSPPGLRGSRAPCGADPLRDRPSAPAARRPGRAAGPVGRGALGLATPAHDAAARASRAVRDQIDDYLLPRLGDLDAPLLTVVGGSTGAGKSTLVNSLIGAPVTTAGVLRPTTRAPVLVCARADVAAFDGDRVLPGLARVTGGAGGPGTVQLVVRDDVPAGLALLDAPDVDSVVESNRELAGQLLAAADLWVFVTTAARYADAVPWDLLRTAQERGTALAVVLDRVPPEAAAEVAADLAGMLQRAGLTGARLFVVEERPLVDGRVPEDQVAPLRAWLHELAADQEARAAVVRQTLTGALDSLVQRVDGIAAAVDEQVAAGEALRAAAAAAYTAAYDGIDEGVRSGTLLRGEVLARWQEFVGTGEWMRALQGQVSRLRDRVVSGLTGRPTPADGLQEALESSVERLLRAEADRAAERTVSTWRGLPAGAQLLGDDERELEQVSPDFPEAAAAQVRDWQGTVLDLVRDEGGDKRTRARLLSWGINGAGGIVMIAVFAQTGGLLGGEVAVAGGTTVVGQRVLEAVFGDAAVRSLANRAREDLQRRVDGLLRYEQARFDDRVAEAAPAPGTAAALRATVAELAAARRSAS
ncbi:PilZ domain-containing protein [Blastococcus brunescens]|uniref:PilZ domain-containing protein n=1 Tax=Blastococcus brunescens TaxID=1564165 RepID=A0ABZ1B2A1_9ACTN|nr:PilZ domain-containing protein [Blastococcus sp. BMG 8361]WRL63893.1 PilZ domain-containing protein [Blastococcus sp. BMG 8361]